MAGSVCDATLACGGAVFNDEVGAVFNDEVYAPVRQFANIWLTFIKQWPHWCLAGRKG